MASFAFETVDVFTDVQFGGNPLAVFLDGSGLTAATMQKLAREFNLSETTFILPPENSDNTARVRIFTPVGELPFAGHPSVGTAYVLARSRHLKEAQLRLEMPAGLVQVTLERNLDGVVLGGAVRAPEPLSLGATLDAETIALCAGLHLADIVVANHAPITASVGNPFVIAEVTEAALVRASPDLAAFRLASAKTVGLGAERFALHLYSRDGDNLHARMFAPLLGVLEDPATGSANAPLAALLLQLDARDRGAWTVKQGAEMGRPSTLHVAAWREDEAIFASVAGRCVPILRGEAVL